MSSVRSRKRLVVLIVILLLALAGAIALIRHERSSGSASSPAESSSSNHSAASPGASSGTTPSPSAKAETPAVEEHTDVAIIGSELEGMYLARAAADEGLNVRVIDPRAQPGGQLLQAQMLFLDVPKDGQGHLLPQGRVKTLTDGFRTGHIRKLSEFTSYYDTLRKGIPLESGIKLEQVEASAGISAKEEVAAVRYRTADGVLHRLTADYWVDNSDYAALVSQLHAVRLPGLEKLYGQPQIEYMSAGMMMPFKNVDWAAFQAAYKGTVNDSYAIGLTSIMKQYQASSDRVMLRGLNAVNQKDGEVLINALLVYTVDPSSDASVQEAVDLGKKEMPQILDFFRKNLKGWSQAELNGVPNYPYIREYNHYQTDYTLQVSDLLSGRMFEDNVSIGGYPLDLQGIQANKWGIEVGRPDQYGMPLRSFQLKDYENVLLAGKNVGASALAYGSARIQPNTALAAETIGIVLGRLHGHKKLRELTAGDWPALHEYLAQKYGIKLTGVAAVNKVQGWTAEELRKLDSGEILYPDYAKKAGNKTPAATSKPGKPGKLSKP